MKQFFTCFFGDTIFTVNLGVTELHRVDSKIELPVLELSSLTTNFPISYFVVQSSGNTFVFEVLPNGEVKKLLKLDPSNIFILSKNSMYDSTFVNNEQTYLFGAYYDAQHIIKIYDLSSQKFITNLRISNVGNSIGTTTRRDAAIKNIYLVGSTESGVFEILTTRHDCRVDFFEAQILSHQDNVEQNVIDGTLEWVRFEALASIDSVEVIDIPLSDAQARIETEFGALNGFFL